MTQRQKIKAMGIRCRDVLSRKTAGVLERYGVETLGGVAGYTADEMLALRGVGRTTWAAAWRGGTVRPADIFAAVDALTAEEQLAEATAFVLEAAADDICGEIGPDSLFQLSDLADEEDVHVRCYVAMCRARSRTVVEESCLGCFKFDGLVCPEHRVTCLYDDCIFCGGCGNAHGYCKCSSKERAKRDIGRHHVLV